MFYWLHKIIRSWLYLLWVLQLGNQTLTEILFFCLLMCFSLPFVLHSTNGFYPKGGFGDLQFDDCRIIRVNNKISWENVLKHVQLTKFCINYLTSSKSETSGYSGAGEGHAPIQFGLIPNFGWVWLEIHPWFLSIDDMI